MHFLVPTSSSSSPSPANTSSFSLLFLAPENLSKPPAKIHIGIHGISGHSSKTTSLCAVVDRSSSNVSSRKESPDEEVLVVRRPLLENSGEDEGDKTYPAKIDAGLSKIAKKMPIFEPERSESSSSSSAAAVARAQEKPLAVNLDLSLYRAKFLARSFRYKDAEKILEKCIAYWPEDGRPYVALGKILTKQTKLSEARTVYEKGCQATQGENAYIWQCWAVLENRLGNVRRARELFDAATVADKKHVAAWHGWANLEIKQGNISKARNLLAKGLKFCGRNEYIYQTLALLEAKAGRYEQARYLFKQATISNSKSCASWLAWAQLEIQQERFPAARKLFEKAVQASPKNRFAWHVWGVFEAGIGNVERGRKLLKIGHVLNPRDPVLLQSLGLLEYKHSSANLARALLRRAAELDPRHQPVWIAWGWMEWKEGNTTTARELYQRALSIDASTESAARCLQAWGVLEQRAGNLSAARRLFRSSLNINSQSYVTWMTWAQLEEDQGDSDRAEEIRNLYFQQRTEVVDDATWVTGFLDIIDPALDTVKRLLNFGQNSDNNNSQLNDTLKYMGGAKDGQSSQVAGSSVGGREDTETGSGFNLDAFLREKLSLDPSKIEVNLDSQRLGRFIRGKTSGA
ncbi:protein high chlorophyll fluorescent 107 [Brassica rapa]|uniref:Pre-mRNA-splicing factor Syf1/CRNKL1-like C-terminal HAT-repeats domain-containing protein n=1 Tax=Brassica campestris TaxID=3711 RepID=M4E094_BRACM|nr:protein high chlorophyll fluorescent 107 [Brassica rapa]